MNVLDLIRAKDAPSAKLRQALADLEATFDAAEFAAAEKARAAALLDPDEKALVKADQALARARQNRDRYAAQKEELQRRIMETGDAEATAALTARKMDAERKASAIAKRLRTEYPEHANALVGMLEELLAAELAIDDANKELVAAGRHAECLQSAEWRAIPLAGSLYRPAYSILNVITLPVLPGLARGWNDATGGAERMRA